MNKTKRAIALWCVVAIAVAALGACLWVWLRPPTETSPQVDNFPVRGIDLSAHNGDVDFDKVHQSGVEFVYLKATEGINFKDIMFERNAAAARKAGLKVGAYHFFRFDASPHMQALNLAQSVRMQPLDLPLVIDIEQWTNPSGHSADSILNHAAQMARILEKQGHKVMFYTNKHGQARWVRRELKDYPLWLCSLTDIASPEVYALWQYSHTGKVPGVKGNVDLNVFCGTEIQWRAWVQQPNKPQ